MDESSRENDNDSFRLFSRYQVADDHLYSKMSVVTQTPASLNQTSSYTSPATTANCTDIGNDFRLDDNASLPEEVDSDIYGYGYWTAVMLITVLGITGNILLLVMMRDRKLASLSFSVYLKFLAVSDSALLIITFIRETKRLFSRQPLIQMYSSSCILLFCIMVMAMLLSPWLVVGLSIDRYVCVTFPMNRERFCTRRKAIIVCTAMLGLAGAMLLPFPIGTDVVDGNCIPTEYIRYYYIFLRLIFSSIVPCLLILIFNILIVIQIQRSRSFRSNFSNIRNETATRQQDSSTRPLVLVSVLAFVTLVPVSVSDCVMMALQVLDGDSKSQLLSNEFWAIFILIYLLNFGQNFYILIGSSTNYRAIIKRRLGCEKSK